MSILGYSELVKEIYGVTPESIKEELATVMASKPTNERMKLLATLANHKRANLSALLHMNGRPRTGGSYLGAKKFFEELVKQKILRSEKKGTRTYYEFTTGSALEQWLN